MWKPIANSYVEEWEQKQNYSEQSYMVMVIVDTLG